MCIKFLTQVITRKAYKFINRQCLYLNDQVLDSPGTADLSVWVDFAALRQAAEESGAPVACHGPVTQTNFLQGLGVQARFEQLVKVGSVSIIIMIFLLKSLPYEGWSLCFDNCLVDIGSTSVMDPYAFLFHLFSAVKG